MLADFFMKPLQGSLFRKFRSVLLGHAHINTLRNHTSPETNEERVGSENTTVPPGSGLTHAASGASNGASNAGTRGKYRVTNEEKTVLNAAHSVEKYPED